MNFIFVGLKEHLVDGIAPRVGDKLIKQGLLDENKCFFCHGQNIDEIEEKVRGLESVAVDITTVENAEPILYFNKGIKPANKIRVQEKVLGTKSILVNTKNVYGKDKNWLECLTSNYSDKDVKKRVEILEKITECAIQVILGEGVA